MSSFFMKLRKGGSGSPGGGGSQGSGSNLVSAAYEEEVADFRASEASLAAIGRADKKVRALKLFVFFGTAPTFPGSCLSFWAS